jgi:molybdopterin/thiamine biosynthesis adenylyltransferase
LKDKHVAVIGLGSGGSAVADMLARGGIGKLTLRDPDLFTRENAKRHVLKPANAGMRKANMMLAHVKLIDHTIELDYRAARFDGFQEKPDVIACCVDSLACESEVNAYSLEKNVPAVYGGVHGDAHTAEIITVIPGETPCYECYEREGSLPEPSQEKYTNPNYDQTKMPHQEGLWCDVLIAASLQVQAVLGVLGVRKRMPPLSLLGLRYPFKAEYWYQKPGCAICTEDFSGLRS